MKICTNCGKEGNGQFCTSCGALLQEAAPAANPSELYDGYGPNPYAEPSPYSMAGAYPGSGEYGNPGPTPSVMMVPGYFHESMLPPEYQPISMWGYFGYNLLFCIPFIGQICLLIFAFGGTRNVNLRNYARSFFCFAIIVFVLLMILFSTVLANYPLLRYLF